MKCSHCLYPTVFTIAALLASSASVAAVVRQSAREIPVAYQVDVVVVGGSTGAVAAAESAAKAGARVFLASRRPYLGEDVCGTLRIWLEEGQQPETPLARKIYSEGRIVRPMHVKKTLDDALLEAGVAFLYDCYATDVLCDEQGKPCGIVMANRNGRQAVLAKVVIDATERAWVARMAGVKFRPFPAGPLTVKRTVLGGEPVRKPGLQVRTIEPPITAKMTVRGKPVERKFPIYEYTLEVSMADGSYPAWAEVEQQARDLTYDKTLMMPAEMVWCVPPDAMIARQPAAGAWPGAAAADLGAFVPAETERFYVLGGCADVPRAAAEKLMAPPELIALGQRLGAAAAAECRKLPAPRGPRLAEKRGGQVVAGDVREVLAGVRPIQRGLPTIVVPERELPVLGQYDVVVVGGGTGGAPAGISAGRHGAKTLLIEHQYGLGGVGTLGLIGNYWFGFRGGFTAELDRGVQAMSQTKQGETPPGVRAEIKMEWYRREARQAGTKIWFGSIGCGAVVEGTRLRGVVVATPEGRGVVLAKVVVDATGNADIAAVAGAQTEFIDESNVAVQGAGLPYRNLGANYTNTDYMFTDDADVVDVWHAFVYAKQKFSDAFDLSPFLDTRERRRVVGDMVLSPMDMLTKRTYPDTFVQAISNFDSHGFSVHPMFTIIPPPGDHKALTVHVPYRCLLPKGLDGILVTGLAVSAHRDAIPVIRMQPDVQNQGYAAGLAGATAARAAGDLRAVDVKRLQRHLVEKGNLPASVLTDRDSYPMPPERIASAVAVVTDDYRELEVILAHAPQALPLLRKAYSEALNQDHKLVYAHILGTLGDPAGAATLVEAVSGKPWGPGWDYRGMGQFGASMSQVDSLVIALGRTRDPRALEPLLKKVRDLNSRQAFSHHRAAAEALEALADPAAARPLAELLAQPGMSGHATLTVEDTRRQLDKNTQETRSRNQALREIFLARALVRCGDWQGQGEETLLDYAQDLRGIFARHALSVLLEKKKTIRELGITESVLPIELRPAFDPPVQYGNFSEARLVVTVVNRMKQRVEGSLRLAGPKGWTAQPGEVRVEVEPGASLPQTFKVAAPERVAAGRLRMAVSLDDSQGKQLDSCPARLVVRE